MGIAKYVFAFLFFGVLTSRGVDSPASVQILDVMPQSLVTRAEPAMQRGEVVFMSDAVMEAGKLVATRDGKRIYEGELAAVSKGRNARIVFLPADTGAAKIDWTLVDADGKTRAAFSAEWKEPRHWTIYVLSSTHTDIGLHNSQYIQRKGTVDMLDMATRLFEKTKDAPEASRFRYVAEGVWFWHNYEMDKPALASDALVEKYVKRGRLGIGAGCAGNCTPLYGFEELCRSSYTRQWLKDRWGVESDTMLMSDFNGMSWSIVQPYADAGFRNILWSPNQWCPTPFVKQHLINKAKHGYLWNPEGRGSSCLEVYYDSKLPMVFYWLAPDEKSKLLVWAATAYDFGGTEFGWQPHRIRDERVRERLMARQLNKLEARYPYDVWLFPSYGDDEKPNTRNADLATAWNKKWRSPEIRTVGNPSEPFNRLREKFDDKIATLSGDITANWSQLALSTPEILAHKFAVDRALPTAEKLASVASIVDKDYAYPQEAFRRAWWALVCNDEHSYGASGYSGRSVFETWCQHVDWIDKAGETAFREGKRALAAIAAKVDAQEESLIVFNPTLQPRKERLVARGVYDVTVPPFGYTTVPLARGKKIEAQYAHPATPPTIENKYYKLIFDADGSLASIYDKELKRELIDPKAKFRFNQFVYTKDDHKTFSLPRAARFEIAKTPGEQTVYARFDHAPSGATIEQRVSLVDHEKRIDIRNGLYHVRDLINSNRYYRTGYYAFPFDVPNGKFTIQMNGAVVDPQRDVTRHGTDTYLAMRDWAEVSNGEFGVALIQLDSHLIECGEIHPDKNVMCGGYPTTHLYSRLFVDWIQRHTAGGSFVNSVYRYVITSYAGDYKTGKLAQFAERVTTPCAVGIVKPQKGELPGEKSFLTIDGEANLLTLKAARDGKGYIARLWEPNREEATVDLKNDFGGAWSYAEADIVENDKRTLAAPSLTLGKNAFTTLRLDNGAPLKMAPPLAPDLSVSPQPIGSVYTGLIDRPRAVHGEEGNLLYLMWGENMEKDFSHYELHRSTTRGFTPDETNFVAEIPRGVYRVARYEDKGLKPATRYYYRVRAVNKAEKKGAWSDEFSASTREPLAVE